jgi:hypothetical protein
MGQPSENAIPAVLAVPAGGERPGVKTTLGTAQEAIAMPVKINIHSPSWILP